MNILHASSEVFPYSKTGGLADATGALARAQAKAGHNITLVTPLYRGIREECHSLEILSEAELPSKVWKVEPEPNLTVLFIDEPELFDRDCLYGHNDDAERFIFFFKMRRSTCKTSRYRSRTRLAYRTYHATALTWPNADR